MKKKLFIMPEADIIPILGDDMYFSTDAFDFGDETGLDGEILD